MRHPPGSLAGRGRATPAATAAAAAAALLSLLAAGAGCVAAPSGSDPAPEPDPTEAPATPDSAAAADAGPAADTAAAPGADTAVAVDSAGGPVTEGARILLRDSVHLVRGRRVGLLTNHTGILPVSREGGEEAVRSTAVVLHEHPATDLVALFAPEHGPAGAAEAGEPVASGRHAETGLPIYSLYGETYRPLPHMLEGVDVLAFDMQDVGARYYTYVWTMALAMEAAGEAGIPFLVLDRPNPIGGVHVQGNVLDPAFSSFIGLHPVPMRHGMTVGEVARLLVGALGLEADLTVIPMEGWDRAMLFGDTGLPWVAPSPNMPSVESALHYPGTCLFEGTNLSVGRGTDVPFQQIGAPWLDGEALAVRMNARDLPGVRFEPVSFTPVNPGDAKFGGERVHGVRLVATDPATYDPTRTAVALLVETREMAGRRWSWRSAHFDRLAGTDRLRIGIEAGRGVDELTAGWEAEIAAFLETREPFLLYR